MKLGVLNAFTPQEETLIGKQEFKQFVELFSHVEHDLQFSEYRVTEGDFPEPGACDAYLITGSPSGAYERKPWVVRLQEVIRAEHANGTPLVGICFGHQILAHALGGRTENRPRGGGLGRGEVAHCGAARVDAPAERGLRAALLPPGPGRRAPAERDPHRRQRVLPQRPLCHRGDRVRHTGAPRDA